jgi:hypothetical protein
MPDFAFAVLATIALLLLSSVGLILLIRPLLYFRLFPNPLMPNAPWNRLQMRAVGLVLCLMLLMMISGLSTGVSKFEFLEGFHKNILIALWASFFTVPILCWILWRFCVDFLVRRGYIDATMEDPALERGLTLAFCSLLLLVVMIAFFLAAMGHYP